ncbi:hypothetical protein [Thermogemmatispora onikobensis]|uniref:hypothetical protein n=1 Tax=Thermogemmatispora onikobensis TaxID=732234 RepID=UPI000853C173|nr:hypothetical protein [Thermogemmatispora onikobensis]
MINLSRLLPRVAAALPLLLLGGLLFSSWLPGGTGRALAWRPSSDQQVAGHGSHPAAYAAPASGTAVLTFKYNNRHSGHNPAEMLLTTSNVNASTFGKRLTLAVDGQVYAQPLYVPSLPIQGRARNVVFVATEHDSVYAFDADATSPERALLWRTSFVGRGAQVPTNHDVACNDLVPEIGITGTPVIDGSTRTLYVVAFTKEGGRLIYRLHALDITTGQERKGSPVTIQASVRGTGAGSRRGLLAFDPRFQRQRAALVLANGRIYIAWGSFCDNMPYHGWIMSYQYNGSAFRQMAVFNDTPDGARAGIWGSGGALTADEHGFLYFTSGNGSFNLQLGGRNAGDSVGKLSPDLRLVDYFTPFNERCLDDADADLGSAAPLLLPTVGELIASGKEGRIYVLARNHLGRYHTIPDACNHQGRNDVDQIVQEFPPTTIGGLFSTPAYWNGPEGEYVYFASVNRPVVAYRLINGRLSSQPVSATPEELPFPGANVVVTSSGNQAGTGILWLVDPRGVLRAYDASNLARELYSSDQSPERDALPGYVKFSVPTVADGRVFVPSGKALVIYGLLARGRPLPSPSQTQGAPQQQVESHPVQPLRLPHPGPQTLPGPQHRPGPQSEPGPARPPASDLRAGPSSLSTLPASGSGAAAAVPVPTAASRPSPAPGMGQPGQAPGQAARSTSSASSPAQPGPRTTPAYNNVGVSNDDRPAQANFDQGGNSYSAQALQRAGVNPGDHVFAGGFVFVWPNVLSGEPDNYVAAGQTLPVEHQPRAKLLGLLGAADHGVARGQLLITFTDGTTQAVPIAFSDWTLDGGGSRPLPGSPQAVSMPYFNSPNGPVQMKCYLFYVSIALPQGKTVKSVTLPAAVSGGRMHVFAVALQ